MMWHIREPWFSMMSLENQKEARKMRALQESGDREFLRSRGFCPDAVAKQGRKRIAEQRARAIGEHEDR